MQPQDPLEHSRDAGVSLHLRLGGAGDPAYGDGRSELVRSRLRHRDLPEGREHLLHVGQEGAVRADDEHSRGGQPGAVRVEQVGGPVQPDRCLAGARSALHADRLLERRTHQDVLLRLDGRDDVAHRTAARPLDLLYQQRADGAAGGEAVVFVRREGPVPEPEAAAQHDALPVARRCAVVGPREGSAPVEHDRLAVLPADVPAAEVEDLVGLGVEAAEEQRRDPVVEQLVEPTGQAGGERPRRQLVVAPGALGVEEGARVLAHPSEIGAGAHQVRPLGGQDVVGHAGASGQQVPARGAIAGGPPTRQQPGRGRAEPTTVLAQGEDGQQDVLSPAGTHAATALRSPWGSFR
ncbi:MAG: hypothetical protein WD794_11220 [Mycobacteriales bacterium]